MSHQLGKCQAQFSVALQVVVLREQFPGRVQASYMSYMQDLESESIAGQPKITFLYKLVEGVADRSFGLNVARMAHLPDAVVNRAGEKALAMEEEASSQRYCTLYTSGVCGRQQFGNAL